MKRSTVRILPIVLALITIGVRGLADPASSLPASTTVNAITVIGEARTMVKPDIAYATLQVVTQDRNQAAAVAANAARTQALIDVLKKSMIADGDIQTDWYTVGPSYDYQNSPPILVGFQVVNAMRVTLRDTGKAGLIVDKATSAGATNVGGLTFDLADRSREEGLALVEAVRSARSKADLIAGATGVYVDRVLSITESASEPRPPVPMMTDAATAGQAPAAPSPIEPREIPVTARVTISYGIAYDMPKP